MGSAFFPCYDWGRSEKYQKKVSATLAPSPSPRASCFSVPGLNFGFWVHRSELSENCKERTFLIMSSPRYLDPKTGKEVVFAHPIDGIEQAALGNVVAEKGTAPAPAPVKQEPKIVAPVASEEPATVEPLLEAPEAPSEDSAERKAPRRRPSSK